MPNESASGPIDAGWAALALGRWQDAARAFEDALSDEETADALEGLSWSAWWLDDAETVARAREHAYRLYRRQGQPAAAARMATWLASDALDFHGAVSVAAGWLRRAHRLLDPVELGPDHGWLMFHEGFLARVRNDPMTAIELGRQAAACGRRFDVADLEMLGLALEGATLVDGAQLADGMRCLDEATAAALEGEASVPISRAWACCFLVTACAAVGDYERASEWCDRIADFAERYGSRYMLAFCRAEYGEIHLWRGRWPEADELLVSALDDFASSRPGWAGGARVTLAELRRRQGRRAEATALVDEAGPGLRPSSSAPASRSTKGSPAERWLFSSGRSAGRVTVRSIAQRAWSCWSVRESSEESSTRRPRPSARFASSPRPSGRAL